MSVNDLATKLFSKWDSRGQKSSKQRSMKMDTIRTFYLIQRGKVNQNYHKDTFMGLMGPKNRFAIGDYMGAAEFEWGAIPESKERMEQFYIFYDLHLCLNLKHVDGRDVYLYCRRDEFDSIQQHVFNFIDKPDHLKEFSCMESALCQCIDGEVIRNEAAESYFNRLHREFDFWWSIDKHSDYHYADWVMFCGDDHTASHFKHCMKLK